MSAAMPCLRIGCWYVVPPAGSWQRLGLTHHAHAVVFQRHPRAAEAVAFIVELGAMETPSRALLGARTLAAVPARWGASTVTLGAGGPDAVVGVVLAGDVLGLPTVQVSATQSLEAVLSSVMASPAAPVHVDVGGNLVAHGGASVDHKPLAQLALSGGGSFVAEAVAVGGTMASGGSDRLSAAVDGDIASWWQLPGPPSAAPGSNAAHGTKEASGLRVWLPRPRVVYGATFHMLDDAGCDVAALWEVQTSQESQHDTLEWYCAACGKRRCPTAACFLTPHATCAGLPCPKL